MSIKKTFITTILIVSTCGFVLTGCGIKEENKGEVNSKPTIEATVTPDSQTAANPTPTPEEVRKEPSLLEDAKKLTQFSDLKNGDFVAEIAVENFGTMKIRLFPKQAPKAVENFVTHAKDGYYDGLTFHRVMNDFMIQGGDPQGNGMGGESIWKTPFEDEFSEDLYPYRGALCMANSGPNTNGSQFFIVQGDEVEVNRLQDLFMERYNMSVIEYIEQAYATTITQKELDRFLIYGGTPWLVRHHTVFGQLIEGFDVLDAIAASEIQGSQGKTKEPVVIETIRIIEYQK